MTTLLVSGAGLIAAQGLLAALGGRVRISLALGVAGMAVCGVAGAVCLIADRTLGAEFHGGIALRLGLDPLSGFFLLVLAVTAIPTLVYADGYLAGIDSERSRRAIAALLAAFLLSLIGVLVARGALLFLLFWELMTMVPAASILVLRRGREVRDAVYTYVAITHLAGVGVWISVLLLAHYGGLLHPHALLSAGTGVQVLVAVAALVGFGAKAGLIPLHSWLPRAHPVAAAPMSALMSGMMVKVAIYGLIRVEFQSLHSPPLWLGLVLLGLGLFSALGGVLWALVQQNLKTVLAYSTVENVGIIVTALGAALLLRAGGHNFWAALAFAAALLHTLNHAIFKTLLFLAAGSFERAAGSLDLDRMGGLLKRMPWTGASFLIALAAIAGVPPLNGFASEWLTLQSVLHLSLHGPLGVSLAGAVALAALGAAAALALLCFANVAGLVLFGQPRTPRSEAATEPAPSMYVGTGMLACGCVALGLVPGLVIPKLMSLSGGGARLPLKPGLTIPGTGSLHTLGIFIALLVLTGLIWFARGRRAQQPAAAPTWVCGQPLDHQLNWTAGAFTRPVRLVLAFVQRPQERLDVVESGGLTQSISYRIQTPSLVDRFVIEPLVEAALRAARFARGLQSGNVRTYASYLIGLVVLALILLASGVLT